MPQLPLSLTSKQRHPLAMNPPGSRGPPPPSFKTNVNRAKTKRWVEAKSYSYDGDDWGDADDFDEYDGYDEPEASQPASARQAGQPSGHPDAPHGDYPPGPQGLAGRGRVDSYGHGDDQRAFSGPQARPMQTAYSQYQQSQGGPRQQQGHPPPQGHPAYSQHAQQQRRPSTDSHGRPIPPANYQGHPARSGNGSRTQSMTSNTSMGDNYRRDFSNQSAMPPALQTNTRPPRKSSLSQHEGPTVEGADFVVSPLTDAPEGAPSSQNQRDRSASGSAPAFVRPADIYRRLHEEKERERLSQESARPSMDAINQSREESPAKSGDEGQKLKPTLEPVAERRSEYGMEGLLAPSNVEQTAPSRGPNGSPMLPDLPGLGSSFGDDFGMSFMGASENPTSAAAQKMQPQKDAESLSEKPVLAAARGRSETTDSSKTVTPKDSEPLQHQPSRGFRSAVHTAFDQPVRQKSSASESVTRSNSDSTNAISPIITRPGSAHHEVDHIATIPEEIFSGSPHRTPRESLVMARPFSEDGKRNSSGSIPGFVPGHRRDINTPSPDNSPARTPILESNKQLRNPQEVELDITTPASTEESASSDEHEGPETTPKDPRVSKELPKIPAPAKVQTGSGTSTPRSRSESPTKGRVRDLADQFEGGSSRGSNSPVRDTLKPREESPARNDSFRPQLPGGWTSYAPSVSSEQREPSAPAPAPAREPPKRDSNVPKVMEDPFAAAAAAGSALAGALVTAVGGNKSSEEEEESTSDKKSLPNSRKPKTDTVLHPEAQRLMAPTEDILPSADPTPLESQPGHDERHSQYFTPVAPLKQKEVRTASGKQLPPLHHTGTLEGLSVENSPNDQESDRLRKELVRELSPQAESFRRESLTPTPGKQSDNPRLSTVTQESTALPKEYDSYWNGSPNATGVSPQVSQLTSDGSRNVSPEVSPPQAHGAFGSLHATGGGHPQDSSVHDADPGKPMLQQRFSWETPVEEVKPANVASPIRLAKTSAAPGPASIRSQGPSASSAVELDSTKLPAELASDKELPQAPIALRQREFYPEASKIVGSQGDLTTVPSKGSSSHLESSQAGLSAVSSGESGGHQPPREPAIQDFASGAPLPPAPFTTQPKVPGFKEIMSLKTPGERLEKLNHAREQVANEDTGLENWISQTTQSVQEHADLVKTGGAPLQAGVTGPSPAHGSSAFSTPKSSVGPSPASGRSRPTIGTTKAKEIFSSSGMKGGKNKAKELFTKGRSRFRSSQGEKVDH